MRPAVGATAPSRFFDRDRDRFSFRAVDFTRLGVDRVLALGPDVARTIFTRFDAERAFAVARAVDRRVGAGEALRLAGVRVSIKDLFDEAGEVTTAGSRALLGAAPAAEDAPAMSRLLAAGAIPFGRTTLSEFAYSGVGLNPHHGTPGNARDPSRIPGGSTSGGAVAVALGLCDVALGSDTGGSIRIPAALNGLAGFKPSQSAVPRAGAFPLSVSYDSVGPIAPSIALCAAVHAVLSGQDASPHPSVGLAGLRLGVVRTLLPDDLDDSVGADYGRALAALSRAGVELRDVAVPCFAEAGAINRTIVSAEAHAVHADRLDRLRAIGDPNVLRRILWGGEVSPEGLAAARAARRAAQQAFDAVASGFDALIGPTLPVVAPRIATVQRDFDRLNALMLRNPSVVNCVDGCAATVPMSDPEGLGTGLMILGRNGADLSVLAIAGAIEAELAALHV